MPKIPENIGDTEVIRTPDFLNAISKKDIFVIFYN